MNRTSFRVGTASASYGDQFYGDRKRIIANAPLCSNGFDDLIAVLYQARDHYEAEQR